MFILFRNSHSWRDRGRYFNGCGGCILLLLLKSTDCNAKMTICSFVLANISFYYNPAELNYLMLDIPLLRLAAL